MKSRNTKQKEQLAEASLKFSSMFTAEELLEKAQKDIKNLGIATVYRFLNDSVKNGSLHSYTCDRKTIYSNHQNNHSHFICEKCGKKMHIDIKNIDFIKKNIPGSICHFQVDVSGVCDNCRNK
ncbi:MAG TPA: transcriptional repressor [Alphaproteobacteria bacterium]|nr:transcriptional repressor [Alphaproteobacteria bacterium]